jgi:hypothetical protein
MWFFPSRFPTNFLYAFLNSQWTLCPAHPIFLDMVTVIIFGERYKLWYSSLYNLFHRALRPKFLLHALFPNIFNPGT